MKFLKSHTHAGVEYQAGASFEPSEIGMDAGQVKWLTELGVVENVQPAPAKTATTKAKPTEAEQ